MFWCGADGLLRGLGGGLESSGGGGVDDAEFVGDLFEFVLKATDGGVAGAMECFELGGDVVALGGEVVGDSNELGEDGPGSNDEEQGEGKDDDECGRGARKSEALELGNDGSEEECEEDGDSQGEEEDLSKIEDCDGEDGDGDEPELRQKTCSW